MPWGQFSVIVMQVLIGVVATWLALVILGSAVIDLYRRLLDARFEVAQAHRVRARLQEATSQIPPPEHTTP